MKNLEKSIEELKKELSKLHKEMNFTAKKAKGDGYILLDPQDKNDNEWYNNDEDYDVV